METNEIKQFLIKLINRLFEEKGIDTNLLEYVDLIDDLGMDSIAFVSIIVEIEEEFEFEVPDSMLLMENFRNIDQIVHIIKCELRKK